MVKDNMTTFGIGVIGTSTTIALGEVHLMAGIMVAIVSSVIMIARYIDYRYKHKLEVKKLEHDLQILKRAVPLDDEENENPKLTKHG